VNKQFEFILEGFDDNFKKAFKENRYESIRGFEENIKQS